MVYAHNAGDKCGDDRVIDGIIEIKTLEFHLPKPLQVGDSVVFNGVKFVANMDINGKIFLVISAKDAAIRKIKRQPFFGRWRL